MTYEKFVADKSRTMRFDGIGGVELASHLYPHQRDITRWALAKGRAAIFADTGLGKTAMQVEWARHVAQRGRVLILTPLAVAHQTVAEAERFGVHVAFAREDTGAQITVANYDMLHAFDASKFAGVVLDESSILKSFNGRTRTALIEAFARRPEDDRPVVDWSRAMRVIDQCIEEKFAVYNGDAVDVVHGLPDESIHYSIFSPPFASLYTYSASPRDMGNCANSNEFAEHFAHLVPELMRVTKPGRLLSFHCMLLPTSKVRDGVIGLSDFRGELIRAFVAAGWIHHSEVVIWKDPVQAMQRTKALGLLHKQIKKDSTMSRQGIPDYLITMRKPGVNPEPVTHTADEFPVALWQRYASPVWMDIDPSDTLQRFSVREEEDEKHICPLQIEVIRRAMQLWTNPGDTVLSPFAGIGSEGHVACEMGRRFIGAELKRSYYEQCVANLREACTDTSAQTSLFGAVAT